MSKKNLRPLNDKIVVKRLEAEEKTKGGIFLPELFKLFMEPGAATQTGSALASMAIYILMSLVLIWRPTGLFGARA